MHHPRSDGHYLDLMPGGAQVNPAMARPIRVRGRDEGAKNHAGTAHGPHPARFGGRARVVTLVKRGHCVGAQGHQSVDEQYGDQ